MLLFDELNSVTSTPPVATPAPPTPAVSRPSPAPTLKVVISRQRRCGRHTYYPTEHAALAHRRALDRQYGVSSTLRVFDCPICEGFYLARRRTRVNGARPHG